MSRANLVFVFFSSKILGNSKFEWIFFLLIFYRSIDSREQYGIVSFLKKNLIDQKFLSQKLHGQKKKKFPQIKGTFLDAQKIALEELIRLKK